MPKHSRPRGEGLPSPRCGLPLSMWLAISVEFSDEHIGTCSQLCRQVRRQGWAGSAMHERDDGGCWRGSAGQGGAAAAVGPTRQGRGPAAKGYMTGHAWLVMNRADPAQPIAAQLEQNSFPDSHHPMHPAPWLQQPEQAGKKVACSTTRTAKLRSLIFRIVSRRPGCPCSMSSIMHGCCDASMLLLVCDVSVLCVRF